MLMSFSGLRICLTIRLKLYVQNKKKKTNCTIKNYPKNILSKIKRSNKSIPHSKKIHMHTNISMSIQMWILEDKKENVLSTEPKLN